VRLAEAERWLDGLINRERQPRVAYSRFGLEAIEALLARIGNPERKLSVVHTSSAGVFGTIKASPLAAFQVRARLRCSCNEERRKRNGRREALRLAGTQMPSQPVASACWQPSSSSAQVWPAFAQYENRISLNVAVSTDP
jgi:hypothetical protein